MHQLKHQEKLEEFMAGVEKRNKGEPEFHQAIREVAATLIPYIESNEKYRDAGILERLTEPDRIVIFPVTWEDDSGRLQINRAWRVQFNNAIGPYKGGLRFHPTVTKSVLKFLGFEQTFKNALTSLPMGGAKGGSNFDPKAKSDNEVRRFCQSLMTELHRHIGKDVDVPAGDIGVGAREIGYLFGQFKRLDNRWSGAITGKGISYGGSHIRTEATGYGLTYFVDEMLKNVGQSLEGKRCAVSGSGNVSLYALEKLGHMGAIAVTASDSGGFIHDPEGIKGEKLEWLKDLKERRRGRISEYAKEFGVTFVAGQRPWSVPVDIALPCATQNELGAADARTLIDNGVMLVAEGANMPTTFDAIHILQGAGVLFAPGKAANAGGVACSGLEQSQNSIRVIWPREKVDTRLNQIMVNIHNTCLEHGSGPTAINNGIVNYVTGANIAGFSRVADAMLAYGHVG